MTIKQMVTETYGDMKVVRPIVESLNGQNLDARLSVMEKHISDEAVADTVRRKMLSQVGGVSNKILFVVLGIGELIIGGLALFNHWLVVTPHP